MLILSLLFPLLIKAEQLIDIKIGQTLQGFQGNWMSKQGDFYRFIVKEEKNNSDLVIMVRAINPGGDPNIYISRKNKYPLSMEEGEVASCQSKGNDLCIIQKKDIQVDETYFVGVTCNGNCRYSIRIDYDEEYILQQNDFAQFKINNDQQSQLIKIDISQYSRSDVELEIEVRVVNYYELENEFNVYLKRGDELPTSESFDYIGKDSWSGSKIIILSLQQMQLGQRLSMSIEAQAGALIQVKTTTYGIQRELGFYETVNGMVEKDSFKVYRLKFDHYNDIQDNDKLKLFIKLVPFSGHATLYVNPSFQPALLGQYKYHYEEQSTQILMISQKEFSDQTWGNEKIFYISIYGNEQCTYEISTGFHDFEYQYIELNVPYEGRLYNDELVNYWFVVTGEKEKNITVSLSKYEGNTNMALKRCVDYECNIIQDDLNNLDYLHSENPDNLFIYSNGKGNQVLIFQYMPQVCSQFGEFYSCTYVVAVYPGSRDTQQNEEYSYQLLVSKSTSHVQLRENTPHKSIVDKNQYNFFKFIVDDDKVQRLSIIVTPIQGQFQIFSSKTEKRPSLHASEKIGRSNVIRYGTEENEVIAKGSYYISVYGDTAGFYTITVIVMRDAEDFRQFGKFAWQYTQLYEGNPQDYVLGQGEAGLYKIDLTNYLNKDQQIFPYKEDLRVELQKESGQLIMYGFDHPTSNINDSLWNSTSEIHLTNQEERYPEILYLRVQPESASVYTSFRIVYRLGWKTTSLQLGENYYGYISEGDFQYFSFIFFKKEDVILTKHAQSYNDSLLQVEATIGDKQFQLETGQGSMVISAQDIKLEKCKVSQSELYFCQLYITVKSQISTFYSLLIAKDDTQIQLTIDEPVYKLIPSSVHHYYLTCYGFDVIINVVNLQFSQQLQILVSIVSSAEYQDKSAYPYPTNSESAHILRVSKSLSGIAHSQVSILQHELVQREECLIMCVILITIKKIDGVSYLSNEQSQYMIQYSSGAVFLQESIPFFGQVSSNEIKFYRANVYTNKTNLMILLSPLSYCEVDLVVSKDTYPDMETFQWASRDFLGDQLVIESGNSVAPDMEGTYYIGVYGFSNCTYHIVYQTGNVHFYQISPGISINLVLEKQDIAYFKYQHQSNQELKILLYSNNQQARFFVQEMDNSEIEESPFFKTIETYTYNNNQKGYNEHFTLMQSQTTRYIIAVKAFADTDFVIAIQDSESKMYLAKDVLILNSINANDIHEYLYYSPFASTLKIEVLKGKIMVLYGSESETNLVKTASATPGDSIIKELMVAPSSHSGLFCITVTGIEEAIFKLTCGDEARPVYITIGEVYDFNINSKQSKQFIYSSVNKNDGYTFSVMATLKFNSYTEIQYSKFKQSLPTIIVSYPNNDSHLSKKQIPVTESLVDSSYYTEFRDLSGEYLIEIINTDNAIIDCEIIFGNNQISTLVPHRKMLGSLQKSRIKYWEYFCPSFGQLFIQIQQCGAQINIQGSDDINSLRNGQYNVQFMNFTNSFSEIITIEHQGQYYLATNLVTPQNATDSAPFTITAQFVNKDSYIPNEDVKAGNGGALVWSIKEEYGGYYLEVTGNQLEIINNNNPDFQILSVQYYLVYDYLYSENDVPFDYCLEIHRFNKQVSYSQSDLQKPLNLQQLLDEESLGKAYKIQFNIYSDAILKLKNMESIHLERYYLPITIRNDYLQTFRWKKYIKYSFFVILAFAVVIVIYKYYKQKKNDESMRFEAADYPNIEMHYRGLND